MQTSSNLPFHVWYDPPPPVADTIAELVSDAPKVAVPAREFTECPPHSFDSSGYCVNCGTLIEDQ